VDQLGVAVAQLAQFESPQRYTEEGVVLLDPFGLAIGQRAGVRQQRLDGVDAGLDFDVAGHGRS
jgi:hypothetical protein